MENIFDFLKDTCKNVVECFFCLCVFVSCSVASALITLHLVRFRKYKISSLRAFLRVSVDWSQLFSMDADVLHSDDLTSATSTLSVTKLLMRN